MTVWVLVFYVAGFNAGGPAVIDNISTKEECIRVQQRLSEYQVVAHSRCIEVGKMK